ncbi:MAG: hypothetical protein ACFCD0_13670 [Gemmataceae bacterium]
MSDSTPHQVNHLALRILTVDDVLTPQECIDSIAFGESLGFQPAGVKSSEGSAMRPGIRNNWRVEFENAAFTRTLWDRVRDLLEEIKGYQPCGLYQSFRFYRYDAGERFKRHRDGHVEQDGCRSQLSFLI